MTDYLMAMSETQPFAYTIELHPSRIIALLQASPDPTTKPTIVISLESSYTAGDTKYSIILARMDKNWCIVGVTPNNGSNRDKQANDLVMNKTTTLYLTTRTRTKINNLVKHLMTNIG